MTLLVPAFLTIGGVHFPLDTNSLSVGIAFGIEEIQALRYSIDQLVNGDEYSTEEAQAYREKLHASRR